MKRAITMNDKVAQIIQDHDTELKKLASESDDALDTFRSTVAKLDGINTKIDASVDLMNQQISNLSCIKDSMLEKRARNEKVKGKIQEFLA
jgi:cell division protein FtsB